MPLDAPMMTAVLRSAGGVITVFLLLRFCGRTASYRRRRPASCLGPRYLPIVSHADFFSAWRSSSTLLPGNPDKELEFPTRAGKWALDRTRTRLNSSHYSAHRMPYSVLKHKDKKRKLTILN